MTFNRWICSYFDNIISKLRRINTFRWIMKKKSLCILTIADDCNAWAILFAETEVIQHSGSSICRKSVSVCFVSGQKSDVSCLCNWRCYISCSIQKNIQSGIAKIMSGYKFESSLTSHHILMDIQMLLYHMYFT